jgi:hypothetical protein
VTYRLLKVVCQVVLVSEDSDGNLVEHPTEPAAVAAKDLPGLAGRVADQIAHLNNGGI